MRNSPGSQPEKPAEAWEPDWARRLYRRMAPVYDPIRSVWSRWSDPRFELRIGDATDVDPDPIRRVPWLERLARHAGGVATLAVFRRPEVAGGSVAAGSDRV